MTKTGIIERVKYASSVEELDNLMFEMRGFVSPSPKTLRRAAKNYTTRKKELESQKAKTKIKTEQMRLVAD